MSKSEITYWTGKIQGTELNDIDWVYFLYWLRVLRMDWFLKNLPEYGVSFLQIQRSKWKDRKYSYDETVIFPTFQVIMLIYTTYIYSIYVLR